MNAAGGEPHRASGKFPHSYTTQATGGGRGQSAAQTGAGGPRDEEALTPPPGLSSLVSNVGITVTSSCSEAVGVTGLTRLNHAMSEA